MLIQTKKIKYMTETKKSKNKKKIVALFIPPLLNYLDWKKDTKNQYFFLSSIINRQEKLAAWKKQKNGNLIQWVEFLNNGIIYGNKLSEVLSSSEQQDKVILVNCLRNKESLQELEKELYIQEKKQPVFFFISFSKKLEADFAELQVENIICPLCEKSWRKKETVSEKENIFRCPEDGEEFNLAETEETTQYLLNDYFKNATQIIEYQKAKKSKIVTLELSIKLDLEMENLHKYLLEKLEKEVKE